MPTFCRHNRLLQNCPICSREQHVQMRPVVTSAVPGTSAPAPARERRQRAATGSRTGEPGGVRVHRMARAADDGYRTPLAPGLRSSADAQRLAEELAFAAGRLARLETAPPGLYAEVGSAEGDVEERAWLAFQIAYICPLDGDEPFAAIERARTSWASGLMPDLEAVETGPRTAHDPARGMQTLEAYRAWAERRGSQAQAFTGESTWTPERRFVRAFERLSLPGLHRDARFDLLTTLGALGVFELRAGTLALGGSGSGPAGTATVTLAAKRALGIGDPMILERRAAGLAKACGVPLAALDLGLYNWSPPPERGERATLGMGTAGGPDPTALEHATRALGL